MKYIVGAIIEDEAESTRDSITRTILGEKQQKLNMGQCVKRRMVSARYADGVRHLTQYEILLAGKGGLEEYNLRVISPTWTRKPKGKGACEKRGKRVKALKRCPARPA